MTCYCCNNKIMIKVEVQVEKRNQMSPGIIKEECIKHIINSNRLCAAFSCGLNKRLSPRAMLHTLIQARQTERQYAFGLGALERSRILRTHRSPRLERSHGAEYVSSSRYNLCSTNILCRDMLKFGRRTVQSSRCRFARRCLTSGLFLAAASHLISY